MISLSMRSLIVLLIIVFLFAQCQSTKRTQFLRKEYKTIYIDEFKFTYFQRMLTKGYNNSKAVQEIIQLDHSGFKEPILSQEDLQLIDSLTTIDYQKILLDSAQGFRRAEGAQGKRPLMFILDKYSSKWLDSLAKRRYKSSDVKKVKSER